MILAGHPKLRNDLRRPTMEEIGYRTDIFNLDGIAGSQRDYINWLLGACTGSKDERGPFPFWVNSETQSESSTKALGWECSFCASNRLATSQ